MVSRGWSSVIVPNAAQPGSRSQCGVHDRRRRSTKLDRHRACVTIETRSSLRTTACPAMTMQLLEREFPNDHLPLLRWLMFTGVSALRLRARLVLRPVPSDAGERQDLHFRRSSGCSTSRPRRIASCARPRSRARWTARSACSRWSAAARRTFKVVGQDVVTADGTRLPPGQVTAHIRNLILKAGLQGHHRLDQTLLLRGLADALAAPTSSARSPATR